MDAEDFFPPDTYPEFSMLEYALSSYPFNMAVVMSRIEDEKLKKQIKSTVEAYDKLCEFSLIIHQWVDEGGSEDALRTAYNEFRRGRKGEFDE